MSKEECYHCGDDVIGNGIKYEDKSFCCQGCKSVYQLLASSDLNSFYSLEKTPGQRPSTVNEHKYAFLDVEELRIKYIDFEDDRSVHITLTLPQIHCSSCIYLLENLSKIDSRIQFCQVNFTNKTAKIIIEKKWSLSELALLLDKIGYAPNFGNRKEAKKKANLNFLYKMGFSGFAFGSIMLWSFPEYLGIEKDNPEFRNFTSYLSFAVSLPVFFYSASDYFISAYKALKFKSLNLDVPISIGILALYLQSCYHIFSGLGPGYMDSFSGFVFFLLIGKWFQSKSYQSLAFDRDYTSYFPVAVTRINDNTEQIIEIDQVNIGDTILLRNQEVLPCDSIANEDQVKIDYSFVTGESSPVSKLKGETVFAGGKILGPKCSFIVLKESQRSQLTQLWNEASSKKNPKEQIPDRLSVYFLAAVLSIAFVSGIVWLFFDSSRFVEITVSVLIVACPCALALSRPFTYGNIMRSLGKKGFYLRSADVIDSLINTEDIVFDKTGTLTCSSSNNLDYLGKLLTPKEKAAIAVIANSSTHVLSRSIANYLKNDGLDSNLTLASFEELPGEGIIGIVDGKKIKIGSPKFVIGQEEKDELETSSYISINGEYVGKYIFKSEFRHKVDYLLNTLNKNMNVHVLSGDRNKDQDFFTSRTPQIKTVKFNQTPKDKYNYITSLQENGRHVMMVGDGLNDAGALEKSDVGVAISEDVFRFTPSSDAIIEATKLSQLNDHIETAKFSKIVLTICYVFSIVYNVVGLSFAISGKLTPLIAAILMPLSSITIVLISTLSVRLKN